MEVIAYRVAGWDTPFWVSPNRWPRRFNKSGRGPVQYWALHPLGPLAEMIRGQGIRTPSALADLRLRVWVARLKLKSVYQITYDNAPEVGLEPHHLISDDYGACQEFGAKCLADGDFPEVIEVPSAALPGTRRLIMFGPRVAIPYMFDAISSEDAATSICADGARPPVELLPLIRHTGEAHAEFVAWENDEDFVFTEPRVGRI